MPAHALGRLEESDIRETPIDVRPELCAYVDGVAILETVRPHYCGLPRAAVQLLIRRWQGSDEVHVHVIGPRTRMLRKPSPPHRAVAVRLAAGAAPAMFGVPVAELVGRAVPVAELWGRDPARLVDELSACDLADHAALVQAALVRRVDPSQAPELVLRRATALLDADPELRVAALSRRLGISERHLRRLFDGAVGLSPKRYARVVRLRRAIAMARARRGVPWAEIAVDAGYYDQAHMISEFRDATGATPSGLIAELG